MINIKFSIENIHKRKGSASPERMHFELKEEKKKEKERIEKQKLFFQKMKII